MPVDELQAVISSEHFVELMACEQLNPMGESRADLRTGILASVLANCHRGKKTEPFKPADFMPKFGEKHTKKKPFDPSALARAFQELAAKTKGR